MWLIVPFITYLLTDHIKYLGFSEVATLYLSVRSRVLRKKVLRTYLIETDLDQFMFRILLFLIMTLKNKSSLIVIMFTYFVRVP